MCFACALRAMTNLPHMEELLSFHTLSICGIVVSEPGISLPLSSAEMHCGSYFATQVRL